MDDFNKALNVEVNKLIKWEAETDVEESEVEAQLKAAVEEEASQEVTQLHLLPGVNKSQECGPARARIFGYFWPKI